MTLLETLKQRIVGREAKAGTGRAKLWAEYRAVLERYDEPRPGDADKLEKLLETLGLTAEHVELHLVVFAKRGEFTPFIVQEAANEAATAKLCAEIDKLNEEIRCRWKRAGELAKKLQLAQSLSRQIDNSKTALAQLEGQFPGLLLGDDIRVPVPFFKALEDQRRAISV